MQPIRDAATVMLLRDAPRLEVFLLRRHSRSSFMANAWVYPGGQLDPADVDPQNSEVICGLAPDMAAQVLRTHEDKAVGLFLAAVRETFEESGVLLTSKDCPNLDPGLRNKYRGLLQAQKLSLLQVAQAEGLRFDLSELAFFAHWITPTIEPKRFDTRFFVARAPEEQVANHDQLETTDSIWTPPAEALDRARRADILLAPPTIRTLEQIAAFESTASALNWAKNVVPPRLIPHFHTDNDQTVLLLPGDPLYPNDAYLDSENVSDGTTRMVMNGSFWRSN